MECIRHGKRSWQTGRRCTAVVEEFEQSTPNSLLSKLHREDRVTWKGASSGESSVKSAIRKLFLVEKTVTWCKLVWGSGHVPKFSFVLWLGLQKKTEDKRHTHQIGCFKYISSLCVM